MLAPSSVSTYAPSPARTHRLQHPHTVLAMLYPRVYGQAFPQAQTEENENPKNVKSENETWTESQKDRGGVCVCVCLCECVSE